MWHFINRQLVAPNVMTVPVDPAIVGEFSSERYPKISGLGTVRPNWQSDISWVAPSMPEAHGVFESAFERLGVAEHVRRYLDVDREVRLYAGFMVIRSQCSAPNFHVDWMNTNNEAFTLLTPVSPVPEGFGLLYTDMNGQTAEYDYKVGEAIVFGDHFRHSTKPGRSDRPVVLLCFEFGTDKMEHWDKILATIAGQSAMLRRPDGEFMYTNGRAGAGYGAP
jgi:hypothetical protein